MLKELPDQLRHNHYMPFVTGTLSGMTAQFVITPIDLVKTRFMADYSSKTILSHVKEVVKEGHLFRSAPSKMLRTGVGNGFMLGTMALVSKWVDQYHEKTTTEPETESMQQDTKQQLPLNRYAYFKPSLPSPENKNNVPDTNNDKTQQEDKQPLHSQKSVTWSKMS